MKRICVTPAGRQRYLEILQLHMKREYERGNFQEWHLWINTNIQSDIDYINQLADENQFIKAVPNPGVYNHNYSIANFYRYCIDEDTVYLRLDDDICFVEKDAIEKMFKFRILHENYFLTCGNTINNSLCGHIHQRLGIVDERHGINQFICMDEVGWRNVEYSEYVHRILLSNIIEKQTGRYKFDKWELREHQRISINVISWFGKDFKDFAEGLPPNWDEEHMLTTEVPAHYKKINCICGQALFSHFSFFTQREHLEQTNLLELYKNIAPIFG